MLYSFRTYRLLMETDTSRLDALLAGLDDPLFADDEPVPDSSKTDDVVSAPDIKKPTASPALSQTPASTGSRAADIRRQLMEEDPTEEEAVGMLQSYIQKVNPPFKKSQMPQIPEISYHTGRFDNMLRHNGIARSDMTVKIDQIMPLQKDFNYNQVLRMIRNGTKDKPLLVIDDGTGPYKLVDGHHKWASIWCKMKMHPDMPDGKEWSRVNIAVLRPGKNQSIQQVMLILASISKDISTNQESEADLTLRKEMEARKKEIDAMSARFFAQFKGEDQTTEPEPAPVATQPKPVVAAPRPAPAPAVAATPASTTAPPAKKKVSLAGFRNKTQAPVEEPPVEQPAVPAPPAKKVVSLAGRIKPKTESRRRSWFF